VRSDGQRATFDDPDRATCVRTLEKFLSHWEESAKPGTTTAIRRYEELGAVVTVREGETETMFHFRCVLSR
jgi:hypothetical protein